MKNGPVIDMTPDGRFVTPPGQQPGAQSVFGPSFIAIIARLAVFGVLVCITAVAFWAALFIIPALILLGALSYAVLRLLGPRAGLTIRRFR